MTQIAENSAHLIVRHRLKRNRLHALLFGAGDCAFLVLVSSVATMAMHYAHGVIPGFFLAMLAGMAAAMLLQMLLAFLVAPLLGSIESMVPSMVIAMISPMTVCTAHLFGLQPDAAGCAIVGAVLGGAMFLLTKGYGASCRRFLRRAYGDV